MLLQTNPRGAGEFLEDEKDEVVIEEPTTCSCPPCCRPTCSCCSSLSPDSIFPAIDRILLISWLLKDFGWMTTNIYLGFPFGVVSVSLHALLVLADPRKAYRFYNASLLCWVTGNFFWMTAEFLFTHPSSTVHVGPAVPLGGVAETSEAPIVDFKTVLFFLGAFIQIVMYVLIYFGWMSMPEDPEEDIVSKNEVQILFRRSGRARLAESDAMILRGERSTETSSSGITLVFVEYAYIIFWISKDIFWSWGTGDLTNVRELVILFESTALLFGTLSILIYFVTAYIYRRNTVRFLDSITVICWIAANFVWMSGEFFIRYRNLELDDSAPGADNSTRIVSSCLFCTGIVIQVYVISSLSILKFRRRSKAYHRQVPQSRIEMFSFGSSHSQHHIISSHSPQQDDEDCDDAEIVIF